MSRTTVGFVIRGSLDDEHKFAVTNRQTARQYLSFGLQPNHVFEMGMTVYSSSAIACSGDGGSGPQAPSIRYCIALLAGAGPDIDDRKRASEQPQKAPVKQSVFALFSRQARSTSTRNGCSSILAINKTSHCFCSATSKV